MEPVYLSNLETYYSTPEFKEKWDIFCFEHQQKGPFRVVFPVEDHCVSLHVSSSFKFNMIKYSSPFETKTSKSLDEESNTYPLLLGQPFKMNTYDYVMFAWMMSLSSTSRGRLYSALTGQDRVKILYLAASYCHGAVKELIRLHGNYVDGRYHWMQGYSAELCMYPVANGCNPAQTIVDYYLLHYLGVAEQIVNFFSDPYYQKHYEPDDYEDYSDEEPVVAPNIYNQLNAVRIRELAASCLYFHPHTIYKYFDQLGMSAAVDIRLLENIVKCETSEFLSPIGLTHLKLEDIFTAWKNGDADQLLKIEQRNSHLDIETESEGKEKIIRIPNVAKKLGIVLLDEQLMPCGKVVVEEYVRTRRHGPRKVPVVIEGETRMICAYYRMDFWILARGIEKFKKEHTTFDPII